MEALKKLIYDCKIRKPKIAVVGDFMVDQYFHISADKLSPEFPIVRFLGSTDQPDISMPGGAANLANMFKYFNVSLIPVGFIDEIGRSVFYESGMCPDWGCYIEGYGRIPIKRRFYDRQFPLCRWDIESFEYGLENIEGERNKLLRLYQSIPSPEVIVFADYNKGVFSKNAIGWMTHHEDAIKIVDPKIRPIERWSGCTIFKLNEKEAKELSGLIDWKRQCDYFQRVLKCIAVVITCGENGVCGKVGERHFEYCSPHPMVCDSVVGAGDCFSAVLGLGMAHAVDILDAVKIASEAAAVYVSRRYNQPVSLYDILARVDPIGAKFVDLYYLKGRDYKLVVTNGVFDIIHPAHIQMIQYAKSQGDKLLVLMDTDELVTIHKGESRPINNLDYRKRILAALEWVDFIIPFESDDHLLEIYKILKPDVLVKDDAWPYIIGSDVAKKTIAFPRIKEFSTTNVIDKIRKTTI